MKKKLCCVILLAVAVGACCYFVKSFNEYRNYGKELYFEEDATYREGSSEYAIGSWLRYQTNEDKEYTYHIKTLENGTFDIVYASAIETGKVCVSIYDGDKIVNTFFMEQNKENAIEHEKLKKNHEYTIQFNIGKGKGKYDIKWMEGVTGE